MLKQNKEKDSSELKEAVVREIKKIVPAVGSETIDGERIVGKLRNIHVLT